VKSRFLLVAVWAYGVGVVNSYAQTNEPQKTNAENSLVKGAWALQFQINNNFSLSSFQGSTLSAKRHFSDKKAVRFGVSLSGSFSDQDQISGAPGTVGPKAELDENSQGIGINTQFVIYPSPDKSVNFFFGAGPVLQFSRSSQTSTSSNNSLTTRNKIKFTAWSRGITGILGVEWFAIRNISFIAEYGSTLGYNSTSQTDTVEQKTDTSGYIVTNELKRNSKGLQLGPGLVKFGVSVYF
jgi:hypothetical protein